MNDQRELRRLARGGLGGLAGAVVTSLGGLAFIVVATWAFPQDEVGVVFTQTSLFLIALAVVTLGSDVGVVRFVAIKLSDQQLRDGRPEGEDPGGLASDDGGHDADDDTDDETAVAPPAEAAPGRELSDDLVGAVMTATLLPVVVLGVIVATALWFLIPLLPFGGETFVRTGQVMALFLPWAAVSNLVLAGTRGFGTVRPTILVESLLRQGLQPVLALAVAIGTDSAVGLALAWVLPYAVSAVAGTVSLHRLARRRGVRALASARDTTVRRVAREVWAFNAPRALTQIAQIGVRRADIPIVAAIAGPAAAAVYTASSRFVAAGLQAIKGIQQMVGPQIARLYSAGELRQAGLALRTATTWNVLIAWPLYLTCATIPGAVLMIFGEGYSSGAPVVVILALGMLAGIAAGPVDIALLMLGRSVQSLRNNMAALATNLVLNLSLVPVLGISGAALAWSASILVSNALPTWQIRPILGSASDRRTLLAAGLAVLCFVTPPVTARLFGVEAPLALLSTSVAGGLVYAGLVHRFRHRLHVAELLSVVRRRGRGRAVRAAQAG